MKNRFALLFAISFLALSILTLLASGGRAADSPQAVAALIIAREKASVEAWGRKDKAFFAEGLADDATFFSPMHPYLGENPKENFLPKFEKYVEAIKYDDFQMFNPRVQVYGDTAVLTYYSSVSATMGGQPMSYTAKVSTVYVRQGNAWRVAHVHESTNPAPR